MLPCHNSPTGRGRGVGAAARANTPPAALASASAHPEPAEPMSEALLLAGVAKRYAEHTAVRNLSLSVPTGTIYGILGPNGAGKSTTLRMCMNIIARDSGRIRLLGGDPASDRLLLRRVGYLPEERGLYKKMQVLDVIAFFAQLKGVAESTARRSGAAWLERMGLGEWRDAKVETLSKGMQQKVQFITTVLHEPELLILDEPHSGLDPVNQEVLRDTILEARRQGRTVILSTHNMEQAEQLCEYVCIIAGGEKVLDGRLREIRRENAGSRYALEFDEMTPAAETFVAREQVFRGSQRHGDAWVIELGSADEASDLLRAVAGLDASVRRFERIQPTLHEVFVSRVGDAGTATRRPEPARV
jgi:ABC-2 type transport system ATP-binding protein